MKKVGVGILLSILLIGFVMALPLTTQAIEKKSGQDDMYSNDNGVQSNIETENQGEEIEIQNQIRERLEGKLTDAQVEDIFRIKNRLQIRNQSDCPNNCTCSGSTTKCQLNGGIRREMTIMAGNSGNIIIQAKGINGSTNVTLYKSDDGKLYSVNRNNETIRVRMLPDQVREKIQERLRLMLNNETITLSEDGLYRYRAEKEAKLFGIFPVREMVNAELNAETGELIQVRNSWWGFLASDEKKEIVGASCGTVTPGENDNCCMSRGYNYWNSEANECRFNTD